MFVFHSKYDEVTGDRLQFYSTHVSAGVFLFKTATKKGFYVIYLC